MLLLVACTAGSARERGVTLTVSAIHAHAVMTKCCDQVMHML